VDVADDAFDDPTLSGFEIAEKEASALTFDIDELSCFHIAARMVDGRVFVKCEKREIVTRMERMRRMDTDL